MSKIHVFLGGTCNGSQWREQLIPLLDQNKLSYFNPVVADWNAEAQAEEIKQRETADVCLYVLTPKMTGVYSVAEVADDSNKRPEKTIFCVVGDDEGAVFENHQHKSMIAVGKLVEKNGAKAFVGLEALADHLNNL